jgi:pterin-4a-carbinolamine dehydratase
MRPTRILYQMQTHFATLHSSTSPRSIKYARLLYDCPTTMRFGLWVQQRQLTASTTSSNSSTPAGSQSKNVGRYDPTAKRPNKVCDPYGQGGKPMTAADAKSYKANIDERWVIITNQDDIGTTTNTTNDTFNPVALVREFRHSDFLSGADFLRKMAAVALINNHYPSLELTRKIIRKNWHAISRVTCRTTVLNGLSTNDFHLAMVRDLPVF